RRPYLGLVQLVVDLGQDGARLDDVAVLIDHGPFHLRTPVHNPGLGVRVLADEHDPADDLGTDVHQFARLERPGGADRRLQPAALHLHEVEAGAWAGARLPLPVPDHAEDAN